MYQQLTGNLSRFFAIQNQEHQEHALQYTLNKEFDILGFKNRFTIGSDYNKSYSEIKMFADMTQFSSIKLTNPNYGYLTNLKDHPNAKDMSSPKYLLKTMEYFYKII